MRIALDAHTLGSQVGGNETYIKNLIRGFAAIDRKNEYFLYLPPGAHPNGFLKSLPESFSVRTLWPASPWIRIPFSTPFRLAQDKIDLLLLQYAAPPVCPAPYVLTIHDISWEYYPDYFKPVERLRLKEITPFSARKAAHVITCSEHSKKDIVNLYKVPEEKVTVTYYGKDPAFRKIHDPSLLAGIKSRYGITGPFILYVGNIQPRKNLVRLIEAFSHLKKEAKLPHKLVIVGKKAWLFSDVFDSVRQTGIESEILFTGYVPDEELPLLYNAADLFVYPSIFEGFGLPVLEALACGTPVITSNTSSLAELAGEAAVLIDPLSIQELTDAMIRVLRDEKLRLLLAEKGLRRASQFTWEKTSRQTLEIFEKVYAQGETCLEGARP